MTNAQTNLSQHAPKTAEGVRADAHSSFSPGELTHTRFYVAVPYVTVTVAVAEPPLLLVAVPTYVPGALGTRKLVLSGWV